MPFQEDVPHAHLITFTTQLQRDVNAQSHVKLQDNSTLQQDNANAQLIKKEPKEFGVLPINHVNVHQNSHCGTENIVLSAQLELNMIQKKSNVITALKDSSEITTVTPVFQVFDQLIDLLTFI